ncbi:MAG: hypothetical protein K2X49_26695 [Acetobacteraceae bacterium]|nr:hypothetical protein [Acetobacteraceae bacterium]
MPLNVNLTRVVLSRADGYTLSKARFRKLRTLKIACIYNFTGNAAPDTDKDTTQFLDAICQDVTDLAIDCVTVFSGVFTVAADRVKMINYLLRGAAFTPAAPGEYRTLAEFAELMAAVQHVSRSSVVKGLNPDPQLLRVVAFKEIQL